MTNPPDTPEHTPHPPAFTRTVPTVDRLCLDKINAPFADHASEADVLSALERTQASDPSCEDMLFVQAQLLDALFKRLLAHDMHGTMLNGAPYMREDELKHALRTQSLSRATAEALSRIRKRKKSHDAKTD